MTSTKILLASFLFLFFAPLQAQTKIKLNTSNPITIGETREFKSEILHENRILNIYLPASYSSESTKKYPVIYLLDGSIDEDFIHIAGLVQFGSFSWINMIPESIIVGIANIDRKKDFTYPSTVKEDIKDFPTTGKSANFIQFIEKELQPYIDNNFNTSASKTIIGQSLGGLLATEILLKKPDLFDKYIIVSPSLWWDNESLLATPVADYISKKSIYVAVGKEGTNMERTARALYDKIDEQKKTNTTLFFSFFEKQNHGDALHLAVYDAFEKLATKEQK
jgi:predicted alpha/beta superfamily hydrolase